MRPGRLAAAAGGLRGRSWSLRMVLVTSLLLFSIVPGRHGGLVFVPQQPAKRADAGREDR
jgi:hypothetical protein